MQCPTLRKFFSNTSSMGFEFEQMRPVILFTMFYLECCLLLCFTTIFLCWSRCVYLGSDILHAFTVSCFILSGSFRRKKKKNSIKNRILCRWHPFSFMFDLFRVLKLVYTYFCVLFSWFVILFLEFKFIKPFHSPLNFMCFVV